MFGEKHHWHIGMKITHKRKMSGSIIKNKRNLQKYVILQTALLHFTGKAIQEGILKEEVQYKWEQVESSRLF